MLRLLERRGAIERDAATDGMTVLPSGATDADPVMAQLAAASTSGTLPAGPERRERPLLHLVPDAEPRTLGALCASDSGFTLHAATTVRRTGDDHAKTRVLDHDVRGLPGLARPPVCCPT